MPELNELMGELPEGLGGTATVDDDQDDDEEETVVDDNQQVDDDSGDDSEEDADDDEEDGKEVDDEDDDDFVVDIDDEPVNKVEQPKDLPKLDNEGTYILERLPKISTNVIVLENGKEVQKTVQVYGINDLMQTPGIKGFVSDLEQARFTTEVNNNEIKARELQGEFRRQKAEQDVQAYNTRENRAVARDLRDLRQEGIFPKFKGVPGSREFEGSDGAKMFDEVIAYMNEQNDQYGQAAAKGEAFYHMSFRQAYRELHPEVFNTKNKEAQRKQDKQIARRVKSGGGTRSASGKNLQTTRVSNINDLASEFAAFTGSRL